MEPADDRREMMAHYETINLSRIASNVEPEMVDEADVLAPGSKIEAIIVEGDEIVDGYHRAAGYMAWARSHGVDESDLSVRVLVVDDNDDPDVVGAAATPEGYAGMTQEDALAMLRP